MIENEDRTDQGGPQWNESTRVVIEIPLPPEEAQRFVGTILFEWLSEQFPSTYEHAYLYKISDPWRQV